MAGESPDRVLHAEDNDPFADLSKRLLEEDGTLRVETVPDAETALERFEADAFDCVVSDHDMPGMTGVELLREVRKRDPDVPFILFTGRGSEEVAADALEADATGYLRKDGPATVRLLANRIRRAVKEYRIATSYAEYETIVESLGDPVYVLDERGRFTFVNDAFTDLLGYDREEVLGRDVSVIKREEMVDRAEAELGTLLSGEGPDTTVFEVEVTTADGETVVCEDHMGVLPFEEDFEGSAGVLRNVSEHRALERRATFLEEIVESAGVGIAVYTADGRFEYANDAYAALLGTGVEDVLGSTVTDVNPDLDSGRFDDYWASYETGETRSHEARHRRADGTTVQVRTVTTCKEIDRTVYHFGTIYPRE